MGEAKSVSVGSVDGCEGSASNEKSGGAVAVKSEGWKGVGVGLAFGADVMSTKGRTTCSGAGVDAPHAASTKANRMVRTNREGTFMNMTAKGWITAA